MWFRRCNLTALFLVMILLVQSCGSDSKKTTPVDPDDNGSSNDGSTVIAGITMVSIQGGTFSMGQTVTVEPVHTVTVSGFEIGMYEVTQGQYMAIMGTNPSRNKGNDNLPVENVLWWDAIKFCNALSRRAGLTECYNESTGACDFSKNGFRLPTEAEWEYACRAGTTTFYNLGDNESDLARAGWYAANSGIRSHPVGEKTPNAFGLYDMHGNVYEFCHDWYGSYTSESQTNPMGPASGYGRVIRGGGWGYTVLFCRSSFRFQNDPSYTNGNLGFRLVRRP